MGVNLKIRDMLPCEAIVFDNASYDNSIIGVTLDGRAIYLYERMVREYMEDEQCSEEDALDWVDYNTLRSLPYLGFKAPIVVTGCWIDD